MIYLEKGETLIIAGREFFVNECQPRSGIVDASTILQVEIGFTQETFQKKQVLADQRFAEKLQSSERGPMPTSNFSLTRDILHGPR